jgi:hypothetical protein
MRNHGSPQVLRRLSLFFSGLDVFWAPQAGMELSRTWASRGLGLL